jgi:hypothetical protein
METVRESVLKDKEIVRLKKENSHLPTVIEKKK